jgi:hypothetical protein
MNLNLILIHIFVEPKFEVKLIDTKIHFIILFLLIFIFTWFLLYNIIEHYHCKTLFSSFRNEGYPLLANSLYHVLDSG